MPVFLQSFHIDVIRTQEERTLKPATKSKHEITFKISVRHFCRKLRDLPGKIQLHNQVLREHVSKQNLGATQQLFTFNTKPTVYIVLMLSPFQ